MGSFSWLRRWKSDKKMSAVNAVRGFDPSLAKTFGKLLQNCSKVFKHNTWLWFGVKTKKTCQEFVLMLVGVLVNSLNAIASVKRRIAIEMEVSVG